MDSSASNLATRLNDGLHKVVVGQEDAIFALSLGLFGEGHVLIEGVPGTAKTLLVRALALLLGADFRRIQFTPDLMPSDVVGTTIFNPQSSEFTTRKGPIFTNLLLADEINRTPPKTQAALLEGMEERQVTIDGVSFPCHHCLWCAPHKIRSNTKERIRCRRHRSIASWSSPTRVIQRPSKSLSCSPAERRVLMLAF